MCLILIDWNTHPDFRLVVAANRDEFHDRASLPADWWTDHDDIYGGRDLQAKGTWLAANRWGQFAAVTNVRKIIQGGTKSRGALAVDFLIASDADAENYVRRLENTSSEYDGYNFIGFDGKQLQWFNNVEHASRNLNPSILALSNASLDTPWPKVERIKTEYVKVRDQQLDRKKPFYEGLFDMLADKQTAEDEQLPDTGVGLALERQLSPIFIDGESYGTRCSTIFTLAHSGTVEFLERRFNRHKNVLGESRVKFEI